MSWDEWDFVWRRQQLPAGATADISAIRDTFESKRRKLRRALLLRNVLEGVGGVLMAVLCATGGWHLGLGGWPLGLGSAIIFSVSLVFLADLIRTRRSRLSPGATLLARVEAEITELRQQRRLIANVGKWYFLPYIGALILLASAFGKPLDRHHVLRELLTTPATLGWIAAMVGVTGIALWRAWRANASAVGARIDPRLEELAKLRDFMRTGGS